MRLSTITPSALRRFIEAHGWRRVDHPGNDRIGGSSVVYSKRLDDNFTGSFLLPQDQSLDDYAESVASVLRIVLGLRQPAIVDAGIWALANEDEAFRETLR